MQDPKISLALSVIMGINLTGDDDKMETEPSPPPPPTKKREPTPPPPKTEDDNLTEEQKQVKIIIHLSFIYFEKNNEYIFLIIFII